MEAIIVPIDMAETSIRNVVPSLGAICVIAVTILPHAVPVKTIDPVVKLPILIGSENTAVKYTGTVEDGSSCPLDWLIVTDGPVISANIGVTVILLVTKPSVLGLLVLLSDHLINVYHALAIAWTTVPVPR